LLSASARGFVGLPETRAIRATGSVTQLLMLDWEMVALSDGRPRLLRLRLTFD